MRKRFCAVLVFFILLLTGCSGVQPERDAVRIAVPASPYIQDIDSNYYKQWLEEKTGVAIEFITVRQERSDEYLSALFAADDADIDAVFFGGGTGFTLDKEQLEQYAANGNLLRLDSYLEDGTNYAMLLEQPGMREELAAQDDEIYFFPNIAGSQTEQNGQVLWLNYIWLKQLGMSIPTTTEELKTVLLAFAQNDPNGNGAPDEIPLLGCQEEYTLQSYNFLLNAFIYNDPYHSRVYAESGTVQFAPTTDAFRQGLIYCRELYERGLLNERCFTYTQTQFTQLVNSPEMTVGGFTSASIADVLYQNNPEIMASFIHVPPLIGENGQRSALYAKNKPSCGAVILANSKRTETVFKVLDTMLSEEASLIAEYGEQGVDWNYSDGTDISIRGTTATIFTKSYLHQTLQNKNFSRLGPFCLRESYIDGVTWNGVNSDTRYIDTRAAMSYETFYPSRRVAISAEPEILQLRILLDEYIDQMIVEFITGISDVKDDSQWLKFKVNCEALGINQLLDKCKEEAR